MAFGHGCLTLISEVCPCQILACINTSILKIDRYSNSLPHMVIQHVMFLASLTFYLVLWLCPCQLSSCVNTSHLKMDIVTLSHKVVQHGIFKHPCLVKHLHFKWCICEYTTSIQAMMPRQWCQAYFHTALLKLANMNHVKLLQTAILICIILLIWYTNSKWPLSLF